MAVTRRSKLLVLALTGALLVALTGSARADEFASDAADPPDEESVATGETLTVDLWVVAVPEGTDGGNDACNVHDPNPNAGNPQHVVAGISSSNTSVVTVSPSSLSFKDCDASKQFTITVVGCATTARTATITIQETSRGPGNSVKGVFDTETIVVRVPAAAECDGGGGGGTTLCSEPAAPAWANAILKANNVKSKDGPQYIKLVAHHMGSGEGPNGGPGTTFDGVAKSAGLPYGEAVHAFLEGLKPGTQFPVGAAGAARPGWACAVPV